MFLVLDTVVGSVSGSTFCLVLDTSDLCNEWFEFSKLKEIQRLGVSVELDSSSSYCWLCDELQKLGDDSFSDPQGIVDALDMYVDSPCSKFTRSEYRLMSSNDEMLNKFGSFGVRDERLELILRLRGRNKALYTKSLELLKGDGYKAYRYDMSDDTWKDLNFKPR